MRADDEIERAPRRRQQRRLVEGAAPEYHHHRGVERMADIAVDAVGDQRFQPRLRDVGRRLRHFARRARHRPVAGAPHAPRTAPVDDDPGLGQPAEAAEIVLHQGDEQQHPAGDLHRHHRRVQPERHVERNLAGKAAPFEKQDCAQMDGRDQVVGDPGELAERGVERPVGLLPRQQAVQDAEAEPGERVEEMVGNGHGRSGYATRRAGVMGCRGRAEGP